MAQYDFGTIVPANKSGAALATDLNNWRDALHSCHKGSTQPSYRVAGIHWLDDSGTPWVWKVYDGADWITIGTINATTNVFTQSGSGGTSGSSIGVVSSNLEVVQTISNVSTNYTILATDRGKMVRATAALTLSLTAAATLGAGWWCWVRNSSTGMVVVDPNGAETIDGSSTLKMFPRDAFMIVCSGTDFRSVRPYRTIDTQAKSGAYTVVESDNGNFFKCSTTMTLTLTAAATMADGAWFAVRNVGTGTVTIDPNASELIDGLSTKTLEPGDCAIVVCDGTGWYTVGAYLATQSAMEAANSNAVYSTPANQHFHPYHTKAVIRFNGTGTVAIDYDGGVALTDNGTGNYTVSFDVSFSGIGYAPTCASDKSVSVSALQFQVVNWNSFAAGSVNILTSDNTPAAADYELVGAAFYGDI